MRVKKILVQSQDYGKDLTGVHNLMKKHKRIENEIQSHEKRIEAVKPIADEIVKKQTTDETRHQLCAMQVERCFGTRALNRDECADGHYSVRCRG